MLQIKVSITEEEHALLQKRANNNLNSVSREARLILRHILYNEIPTPASSDPTQPQPQPQPQQLREIAGIEFPEYKITSHAHTQITPPGVQSTALATDTSASTIDIKPGIVPDPIPTYQPQTQPQIQTEQKSPTPTNERPMPEGLTGRRVDPIPTSKFAPKKLKNTLPVSTDLEIEQVDNEWDAECNEYSTEDFLFDLKNLEEKMREDSPFTDPTKDPDYLALKNYFIKHDLRERFRSLLSDPSRFYPEEGVYEQPQIRYAQAAFRKEKIDEEYIIALLSGTGDTYRATHHMKPYVDEM